MTKITTRQERPSSRQATAVTQPPSSPFPLLSLPLLPSLFLAEIRKYHPWENFGITDACRWVLEHFRQKYQL